MSNISCVEYVLMHLLNTLKWWPKLKMCQQKWKWCVCHWDEGAACEAALLSVGLTSGFYISLITLPLFHCIKMLFIRFCNIFPFPTLRLNMNRDLVSWESTPKCILEIFIYKTWFMSCFQFHNLYGVIQAQSWEKYACKRVLISPLQAF